MLDCPRLTDGHCEVAGSLASLPVLVPETSVCDACEKTENPRSANRVTCGLAIRALRGKGDLPLHLVDCAKQPISEPVGTCLKELLGWFVWSKAAKECSKCKNREQVMNIWGADKCESNIEQILEWLEESAREHGLLYNRLAVRQIVRRAIRKSRNRLA